MEASKPANWVEQAKLSNPEDVRPKDWDDKMDGEWQVKSGTILDNMMIANGPATAKAAGEALWAITKDAEKKMKDKQDEVEKAEAEHCRTGQNKLWSTVVSLPQHRATWNSTNW